MSIQSIFLYGSAIENIRWEECLGGAEYILGHLKWNPIIPLKDREKEGERWSR